MPRLDIFAGFACIVSSGTFAGRVTDPTFEYTFDRAECLSGYATDTYNGAAVFGNLNINTSAVTCKGLGVEAKPGIRGDQRIVSTSNSSRFMVEIAKGGVGWTFETWATFQNFSDCPSCTLRHMVSIGSTDENMVGRECAETSSILFHQYNLQQSVGMAEPAEITTQCREVPANFAIEWGLPVHVVFTTTTWGVDTTSSAFGFDLSTARWYINGVLVNVVERDDNTAGFQGELYLQLLNDAVAVRSLPLENAAPSGSVFLIAMYNWPLNENEVAQNYDAGLANSPPVAEDISVTIWEDGEIGDHYDTPGLYVQDPTMVSAANLPDISLLVVDIDQTKGFPGNFEGEENIAPDVFVDGLPSKGTLFDINGLAITVVPHYIAMNDGYHVRYRPDKDEYSGPSDPYTSFTYSAVDGVTGETSVVPGVIDIYVLPKNDPPVPNNVSVTMSAGNEQNIFLDGTDVDSSGGDTIEGALVVELPMYGVLYQVFENKTRSNVEMKTGDHVLSRYVSYVFTGNISRVFNASFGDLLINDKFTFLIYDSLFALSSPGLASLEIISGLKALTAHSQNDSSWLCEEDLESLINAYAKDSSDSPRNMSIVISAVPEHGSLLRVNNNNTLHPGDMLEVKCSGELPCMTTVKYQPEKNFFNLPTSTWNGDTVGRSPVNEHFSFYAVAGGEYSNEVVQEIEVTNSNDPCGIRCSTQAQYVQAVGTSVHGSGDEFSPLDRIVIIGVVAIDDPDDGVDIVKVKISVGYGLISLNQDYVGLLDFNSATYCYEQNALQCLGTGNSNRELVFFAEPHIAQMALNGMVYQSVISDIVDTINITVLDGANGDCLDEAKFRTESIRPSCLQVSCAFNVTVHGRDVAHKHLSKRDLPIQACLSGGVSLCVLAYIVVWRCDTLLKSVKRVK